MQLPTFPAACIVTANPYAYYARVASLLNPYEAAFSGASERCAESTVLASAASGRMCRLAKVRLGEGVVINAGCVIGDGAAIGDGSVLIPGDRLSPLPDRSALHHPCRCGIGADGFGFAPDGQDWVKIPQIGRVLIGNDVEIGAIRRSTRGALDDTIIEDGCKLDNLVHIGHNCVIGRNSAIAGCVGIAGSTVFGEHCIVGGAGMISGHLNIVAGTTISGGSTLMKSIAKPGVHQRLPD
jgi:UDP-3-O-[3-hydroxymyristoyl] glucosamine N-acyltransferase